MTDNTMREAMIDQDGAVWEKIGGAWSLYKPAQSVPVEVFDSHCNYASFAGRVCNKCGRIHDGGKSVAVVGEPVAWVNINKHGDITRTVSRRDRWSTTPVYRKPTNSIPAADLARLRENAAEADELRKDAEVGAAIQRAAKDLPEGCDICINIESGAATVELYLPDTDASFDMDVDGDNRLAAEIHAAVDAAIAQEKVK